MRKRFTSTNKLHMCIYVLSFIFYFWIASQIPYTHDDWDWGLDVGLRQFLYATVNSRYAGNFIVVIMTRSEILKTLLIGSCCFLIPYLLSCVAAEFAPDNTEQTRFSCFLVANLLLLAMDRGVWREVYGWVSGFANYAFSALFFILWLHALLEVFAPPVPPKKHAWFFYPAVFVFSIVSQLFLENLAVYQLILSLFLCIVSYARDHRVPAKNRILLLGSAIGLVIMFSSNLYGTLLSTGTALDNARTIPLLSGSDLASALYLMCLTLLHLSIGMYAQNHFLTISILAALSFLVYCRYHKSRTGQILLTANLLLSALIIISFCYDHSAKNHLTIMYVFDSAVSVLYFADVCIHIWLLFRSNKVMFWRLACLWLSVPIIIAPLAVTSLSGSRLYYSSNMIVILFGLLLFNEMRKHWTSAIQKKTMCSIAAISMAFMLLHSYVYAQIGACNAQREAIIEENKTNHGATITLPAYPFSSYLHYPNPAEDIRVDFFKEFYGIADDVTLIFE